MMRKLIIRLVLVFLLIFSAAHVSEPGLLNRTDVKKVMKEMLDQHVGHHSLNEEIVKKSIRLYIDQFDPDRIYLLESEVDPFVNMSAREVDLVVQGYKRDDLSKYEELNDLIQKAIIRARTHRTSLYRQTSELKGVEEGDLARDTDSLARNHKELQERIENHIKMFLVLEKDRLGESVVVDYIDKRLELYENHMQAAENEYLFVNRKGIPMSQKERDNYFAMHVLKAMAKSLDSHTSFFKPSEAYDMRVRLEKGFHGIGIVLAETPKGIVITNLIKEGPAAKSRLIKVNDQLLEIDNVSVEGKPLEELVESLRKEMGSKVNLTLRREGERILRVTLKSELVTLDEGRVETSFIPYGDGIIGKITMDSFYQGKGGINSEQDIRRALKELDQQGKLKGLILDLRENSGGFLSQAVKVAGLFITNGVVVISKYSNGDEHYYRDMDGKVFFTGPLVVLTSKATASAAEIVAQALQDYGVAVVVGDEQTYGKGTIQSQTVTNNQGGSYFKVTVGKYYTVSGKTPQIRGVKADIVVPGEFTALEIGEGYLKNALQSDDISSAYRDNLQDIEPGLKPWYTRYYVPTLQEQETLWKQMIPALKKKSLTRIDKNREYQFFLQEMRHERERGSGAGVDYQMEEGVNIIKDMIELEKSSH